MSLSLLGKHYISSTYNNDLTVKSTAPDPRWTGCQQDKERQLYDELRNALPLSSSREINDLRPSTSFSRFWNCNCALIAGDFEARLKYEVERIRDSLEWYALEGEWFGCQRSQDEVEEDVHGRVRIIACLHEGVELLRKGVFDRALEGGDLVYCGRRYVAVCTSSCPSDFSPYGSCRVH